MGDEDEDEDEDEERARTKGRGKRGTTMSRLKPSLSARAIRSPRHPTQPLSLLFSLLIIHDTLEQPLKSSRNIVTIVPSHPAILIYFLA